MGKDIKVFVSHGNTHHKVTSAEEGFTINWIRWSILWVVANIFLYPPLSLCNGLINRLAMAAETGYAWILQPEPPLIKNNLATQSLLSAQHSNIRDQHWVLNMVPFPKVINLQPGGRLIIFDHFRYGRDCTLPSLAWHLFWIWICLSCM